MLRFQRDLVEEVSRKRARGVVVDVAVLDVIDSFAANTLRQTAQLVSLKGAETVVVGINPTVAMTMVGLGPLLSGVRTALDLEEGVALLDAVLEERPGMTVGRRGRGDD